MPEANPNRFSIEIGFSEVSKSLKRLFKTFRAFATRFTKGSAPESVSPETPKPVLTGTGRAISSQSVAGISSFQTGLSMKPGMSLRPGAIWPVDPNNLQLFLDPYQMSRKGKGLMSGKGALSPGNYVVSPIDQELLKRYTALEQESMRRKCDACALFGTPLNEPCEHHESPDPINGALDELKNKYKLLLDRLNQKGKP